MKKNRTRGIVTALAFLIGLAAPTVLAACTESNNTAREAKQNVGNEQAAINQSVGTIHNGQPVPVFKYSQAWQTLIDVETIQAQGTHGTAIVTSLDGTLLWWCPTIGSPVPSTYQLTGRTQWVDIPGDHTRDRRQVDQAEPTGMYVGDSAATYVLCLDNNGKPFLQYDEANIRWSSGVINGLPTDKRAKVDEITFQFGTEKK